MLRKYFWRSLQNSVVSVCFWGDIICWHWKLPCLFEREAQCKVLEYQCPRIDNDVCLLSLREDWVFCKVSIEHLIQRTIIAIPWIDLIDNMRWSSNPFQTGSAQRLATPDQCAKGILFLSGSEWKMPYAGDQSSQNTIKPFSSSKKSKWKRSVIYTSFLLEM